MYIDYIINLCFRAKNVLKITTHQHVEMKRNNIIAPFVFKKVSAGKVTGVFVVALMVQDWYRGWKYVQLPLGDTF